MNNHHFRALIESLKDLTPMQKRYLLNHTKIALDDERRMLSVRDILTPEELEALLSPIPTTNTK
ncbi:hypothetical protein [Vibrio sp. ES.051]|uniref:hypothetical protein n=1 Tax=Vibrio sp. ES.051 TaxID=1761909 RepID=UPI000BFA5999|nr:hypothetical protein [Vibrio sp. ES.051]